MWAVHRRTARPSEPLLTVEAEQPLLIDLAHHEVTRSGRRLHLTGTESHYLRGHVAKLRKKLGDQAAAPRLIETTPSVGYRWIGTAPPASRVPE